MPLTVKKEQIQGGRAFYRITDESGPNAALAVFSKMQLGPSKIDRITIKYSAAVSLDITITLDSGAGPTFDAIIRKITLTAEQQAVWVPDKDNEKLMPDDQIRVDCPAGGGVITSAVALYQEQL